MKSVAIIQARLASTRLPGKVLMDIEGTAMLGRVVERTRRSAALDEVVVATSTDTTDDSIDEYCRKSGIPCMRGSHFDVLDRYYTAARQMGADTVIRITADCPLMDPSLIDAVAGYLPMGSHRPKPQLEGVAPPATDFDFVATRLPPPWPRTYPIGLDVEGCTYAALERAWREAVEPGDREHVMPYLYKGVEPRAGDELIATGTSHIGMRIAILNISEDLGSQRWTVDTAADLEFVRQVYRSFGGRTDFTWVEVASLLRARPELLSINAAVRHKRLTDVDSRMAGDRLK